MSDQKPKLEKITTPAGIAHFPKLNKPETEVNGTKLDKPRFTVGLILDTSDKGVPEFLARLDDLHEKAVAVAEKARLADPKRKKKSLSVNPVYHPHTDKDGNDIEGKVIIRAKTNALNKDGAIQPVTMFNAKGIPTKANVGGGSRLKLSVTPSAYDTNLGAGLTLFINAVQVLELKTWGGGDAGSYGFGAEEGYDGTGEGEGADATNVEPEGEPMGEDAPAEDRQRGNF